jgi:hypothetical protein
MRIISKLPFFNLPSLRRIEEEGEGRYKMKKTRRRKWWSI